MNEGFDIIVISLRTSVERRVQVAGQLNAIPYAWSFQNAIHGASLAALPQEYDREKHLYLLGFDMIPGQIGAFLSHREVWKKCVASQKLTLVMEDDFLFRQPLDTVLPMVLEDLPCYDILKLQGHQHHWRHKVLKDHGKNQLVKHYHDTFGTVAYFIKPESAKVLLKKSNRFYAHVDDFFGHDWVHKLNILCLWPYPVVCRAEPSTIGRFDMKRARLSRRQKLVLKLHRLPRSIAKKIYRMRTFPRLYFKKAK